MERAMKGQLDDGRDFWIFDGKPWDERREQKGKYARFTDGTVHRFSGFEDMESVETKTEDYPSTGNGDDYIKGLCRGQIKFDGVVVYGFLSKELQHGLLAYGILAKLRWLRRTVLHDLSPEGMAKAFAQRPVWYREIPARVHRYDATNGILDLIAESGHEFPSLGPEQTTEVVLLSELIRWDREEDEE